MANILTPPDVKSSEVNSMMTWLPVAGIPLIILDKPEMADSSAYFAAFSGIAYCNALFGILMILIIIVKQSELKFANMPNVGIGRFLLTVVFQAYFESAIYTVLGLAWNFIAVEICKGNVVPSILLTEVVFYFS